MTKIAASRTRPVSAILSCADGERETLPSRTAEEIAMIGSPNVVGSGRQSLHLGQAVGEAGVALFRADRDSLGADEFGVDAEEGEHRLQIGLDMFEAVAGLVKSAARNGDDHPLAAGEAFGAVRRIVEGLAGHRDAVDPRLELRRNAEIIHWRADDDGVG